MYQYQSIKFRSNKHDVYILKPFDFLGCLYFSRRLINRQNVFRKKPLVSHQHERSPIESQFLQKFVIWHNHGFISSTGSPFKFHVDPMTSGYVYAHGPGLSHGVSGQPCNFTIVTKDAGAGGLALAVEGPSKAEITCKDNKDGTCSVSYMPTCPGEYNIIIKFADQHISGSPFTAKITGPGEKHVSQIIMWDKNQREIIRGLFYIILLSAWSTVVGHVFVYMYFNVDKTMCIN